MTLAGAELLFYPTAIGTEPEERRWFLPVTLPDCSFSDRRLTRVNIAFRPSHRLT